MLYAWECQRASCSDWKINTFKHVLWWRHHTIAWDWTLLTTYLQQQSPPASHTKVLKGDANQPVLCSKSTVLNLPPQYLKSNSLEQQKSHPGLPRKISPKAQLKCTSFTLCFSSLLLRYNTRRKNSISHLVQTSYHQAFIWGKRFPKTGLTYTRERWRSSIKRYKRKSYIWEDTVDKLS